MKILTILGARPQFIKSSAISNILNLKYKNKVREIVVHTGQHYDYEMSKVFFKEFKLKKPKHFLKISGLNHLEMTGKMIFMLDKVILKEKPNLILVYGDTNSTLAGAIASVKKKIPVAHVEAGLRSKNNIMQEEINRVITDRVSKFLFCPTVGAKKNLIRENFNNFKEKKIFNFGDVMLDIHKRYSFSMNKKSKLSDYYLVTIHREENCEFKIIENIINNLEQLAKHRKILFPAHPRVKQIVKKITKSDKIIVTEPMNYINFGKAIYNSFAVITDSGGVQKESFFFKKNCFILRKETEWPELIKKNYNVLINPQKKNFYRNIISVKLKKIDANYKPYGDGYASNRIIKSIYNNLLKKN